MSIQRNVVLCPQTSILCSWSYYNGKAGEYAGLQGEVTAFVGMAFNDIHNKALLISSPLLTTPGFSRHDPEIFIEVTSIH